MSIDGTGWSLDIACADRALETHGDNNCPGVDGKPNDEPSKTFNRYLAAIKKLIDGKNFA